MKKIRKGDEVVVITGKDKGRRGAVLQVLDKGERLLIDGINMAKKCIRANPDRNQKGGIIDKPMPIHRSNVMVFNPATGRGDRVGIRVDQEGARIRYFKSTQDVLDVVKS